MIMPGRPVVRPADQYLVSLGVEFAFPKGRHPPTATIVSEEFLSKRGWQFDVLPPFGVKATVP